MTGVFPSLADNSLICIVYLLIVCWIRMTFSITLAWPSFTVKLFRSENTTLDRPMSETETALFGSLFSMGALIGTPLAGLLLDVLGRKKCAMFSALIHVISWSFIFFTKRVEVLLACMFIAGTGSASFVVIPVYISEICQPEIRGTMASLMIVFYCFGMLESYLIGAYMKYTIMCSICLSAAVSALVMTLALKESPVFLMKKGRQEEAAESVAFYRGTRRDSKTVVQEIDAIRRSLNPEEEGYQLAPMDSEKADEEQKQKTDVVKKQKEKLSILQFYRKSGSTRKASYLACTLMVSSIFQGYVALSVYAEPLFKEAVPNLSPILCSVLAAIIAIMASLASAYLVDIAGRRPLMLYSSLGSGVCCLLLGSQLQLHWGPHIVTAVIIYLFCFIYTAGAGAVPFVLAAELFVPEVSSVMSMVVYELAWLSTSIVLFAFGPLVNLFGLSILFYIFSIVCFLTTAYTAYFLPETKGLSINAIQQLLVKNK